jgi:hypothetical protein
MPFKIMMFAFIQIEFDHLQLCLIYSLLTIVPINIRDRLKSANMKFDRYKIYCSMYYWWKQNMVEYVYLNGSLFLCCIAAFGIEFVHVIYR